MINRKEGRDGFARDLQVQVMAEHLADQQRTGVFYDGGDTHAYTSLSIPFQRLSTPANSTSELIAEMSDDTVTALFIAS